MANDAFALSPMSASAALPSEADYEAISEAFMETSRGRWFLKEYARRNRNADTAMVLEAVARIEAAVAGQNAAAGQPDDAARLDEALVTVRAILDATRTSTELAIAELSRGEGFSPARKAVRIVREVAWRLREVGYDGRICDILETQANAVDANLAQAFTEDLHQRVAAAFAEALAALEAIGRGEAPVEARPAASATPPMPENVVSLAALKPAASAVIAAEPAVSVPPAVNDDATAAACLAAEPSDEAAVLPIQGSAASAETLQAAAPEPTEMALDQPTILESHDDIADLGQIAAGADAADHLSAADALVGAAGEAAAGAMLAADEIAEVPTGMLDLEGAAGVRELEALAGEASADAAEQAPSMPTATTELQAEPLMMEGAAADKPPLSLGASLLARGMVSAPRPDPLASLRRMSQAEKIAFFS